MISVADRLRQIVSANVAEFFDEKGRLRPLAEVPANTRALIVDHDGVSIKLFSVTTGRELLDIEEANGLVSRAYDGDQEAIRLLADGGFDIYGDLGRHLINPAPVATVH